MATSTSVISSPASVSQTSTGSPSQTLSGSVSGFTSPLFSQTFSRSEDPFPSGGGSNTGVVGGTGPSIASSAGLYLYTFLATLVLLLSVSAAIILRSLIIRRRHRRLVEEAIANGTWVPPSPTTGGFGGNRPARVDLSRKPRMWEAFVGDDAAHDEKAHHVHRMERETDWDWDSIRPFFASYVPESQTTTSPAPPPQSTTATPPTPPPEQPRVPVMRRLRQMISPTPAAPMVPLPFPPPESHANSSPNLNLMEDDGPKKLRVAVLIAMPSQSHSQYGHSPSPSRSPSQLNTHMYAQASKTPSPLTLSPPSPSSSPSPSPSSQHPPHRLPHPLSPSPTPTNPEEPELPHLEFGIAELVVREDHDDAEDGGQGSDSVRKSVGSSVEVV